MKRCLMNLLCIAACACCLLCACSVGNKDSDNGGRPVIEIGSEVVTYSEYRSVFDNYVTYMQFYGQDPFTDTDSLESYQDWVTDVMTDDLVTLHQASANGFTLTDEQEAEVQKLADDGIKEVYDELMKYAEEDYANDPSVPVKTYFESLVYSESLYHTGEALGWEDYKTVYAENVRKSYIVTAYRDKVCEEFHPAEDYLRGWYDTAFESDKANYSESPEKYKTDMEYFEQNFGTDAEDVYPLTYAPSGYSRIMEIVCKPVGELPEDHANKLARMEEIKQGFSDLAFEDAVSGEETHKAQMDALLSEYKALKEATDSKYEEYLSEAGDKIREAYAKLEKGADFKEIMLEYTEDVSVTGEDGEGGCEAFREKGRLISLRYTSANDWSDAVKAEFKKLAPGEYSKPFIDGGSWHIIFYASDEPAGEIPFDSVRSHIEAVTTETLRDSMWESLLEEWKRDPELTIHEELIRTVGVDELKGREE